MNAFASCENCMPPLLFCHFYLFFFRRLTFWFVVPILSTAKLLLLFVWFPPLGSLRQRDHGMGYQSRTSWDVSITRAEMTYSHAVSAGNDSKGFWLNETSSGVHDIKTPSPWSIHRLFGKSASFQMPCSKKHEGEFSQIQFWILEKGNYFHVDLATQLPKFGPSFCYLWANKFPANLRSTKLQWPPPDSNLFFQLIPSKWALCLHFEMENVSLKFCLNSVARGLKYADSNRIEFTAKSDQCGHVVHLWIYIQPSIKIWRKSSAFALFLYCAGKSLELNTQPFRHCQPFGEESSCALWTGFPLQYLNSLPLFHCTCCAQNNKSNWELCAKWWPEICTWIGCHVLFASNQCVFSSVAERHQSVAPIVKHPVLSLMQDLA